MRAVARFLSIFRPKPRFLGRARTLDSVKVNRKFNAPTVWMSRSHFAMWIEFLRQRCSAGDITRKKLREKVRLARRSLDDQIWRVGRLPEDMYGESEEDRRDLAQQIARKAAVSPVRARHLARP
ncbi:MAG: hypothetical protein WB562_06325 [Candidatus Sulfotelmatobacter sp.]